VTTKHHEIEETIAAYALDSMSETERAIILPDLLDHLSACDDCRGVYHDFRATAGDLALGVPAEPVTPAFEAKVMGAIRGEARPVAAKPSRSRWAVRAMLAASLAAVAALGLFSYSVVGDLREERARIEQSERVLAVLSDPTLQRFSLTSPHGQGAVTLAVANDGRAVLTGSGLPSIPDDRVFELWLMQNGTPVAAGVFTASGGDAILLLDHDPRRFDAAAITVEPGPAGTQAPTSDVIYSVKLRA